MARSRKKLGEILIGWGVLTADQADKATAAAKGGKRFGDAVVELGFAKEDQVAKALAHQFGMEYVDLSAAGAADKIDMKLIPDDRIKKHTILPLSKNNGTLTIAISRPSHSGLFSLRRPKTKGRITTSTPRCRSAKHGCA